MKTLTLDYSKWRCGAANDGKTGLGTGNTALINMLGYQCCLGQFCQQLNKGIKQEDILRRIHPSDVLSKKMPFLATTKKDSVHGYKVIENSNLSYNAMDINDDPCTTISEKILSLRKLFGKKGFKIRVINRPK